VCRLGCVWFVCFIFVYCGFSRVVVFVYLCSRLCVLICVLLIATCVLVFIGLVVLGGVVLV